MSTFLTTGRSSGAVLLASLPVGSYALHAKSSLPPVNVIVGTASYLYPDPENVTAVTSSSVASYVTPSVGDVPLSAELIDTDGDDV